MDNSAHILLIDTPDAVGLIAKITTALYERNFNILSNHQFVDQQHGHFFMRTAFAGTADPNELLIALQKELPPAANVRLAPKGKKRLVVLATKEAHCLGDLLIRAQYGELNATVEAVIANYDTLSDLVAKFGIPFHKVAHEGKERLEHAMEMAEIIKQYSPDYLILTKYMRILPPEFIALYRHRIINIHHSFLPAFIGANPYRQAYERGVKIIGATAHFVTDNLDEGPIIHQAVAPVTHRLSAADMALAGKDLEKLVLSKAISLVMDDRVFVINNKTVVFE